MSNKERYFLIKIISERENNKIIQSFDVPLKREYKMLVNIIKTTRKNIDLIISIYYENIRLKEFEREGELPFDPTKTYIENDEDLQNFISILEDNNLKNGELNVIVTLSNETDVIDNSKFEKDIQIKRFEGYFNYIFEDFKQNFLTGYKEKVDENFLKTNDSVHRESCAKCKKQIIGYLFKCCHTACGGVYNLCKGCFESNTETPFHHHNFIIVPNEDYYQKSIQIMNSGKII